MELDEIIAKHLEDYHCGESRAEHGLTKALPKYIDTGQFSLPLNGGDIS